MGTPLGAWFERSRSVENAFRFMQKELVDNKTSIAVVGLGYVGMPLAVAFARKGLSTIGFDTNCEKIALYHS